MAKQITEEKEAQVYASCIAGCPVHTDTRQLVEFITRGRYEQALELLLDANPFSSVCGRICHHPCEQKCRRAKVDAPVALRALKRFVVETTTDYRAALRGTKRGPENRGERIAIIGSGPSGLTAAHDLAMRGFRVAVFEKTSTPGGMLGMSIPRYRLPYEVVKEDIEDVLALGVELRTDCEVGKHVRLDELRREGFSAFLIATGLSESRTLGVPGIDSEGVLLALPFLRMVAMGRPPAVAGRVAVIGGGNVAVDVARSVARLGPREVRLICLESRKEMPAWDWEISEATDEGVRIMNSWGPSSIFSDEGVVRGIELRRCVRVFDETGRFSPAFDESDTATVPAEMAILAIGQRGDLTCVQGTGVKVGPGQRLDYDPETMSTSEMGVFACGEVVTGPGSAVEAVRDGHRAATAIVHYIERGELLRQPHGEIAALGELPSDIAEKVKKSGRIVVELPPPEKRIEGFFEIERGLTEAEALAEARRCLACTTGALVDEARCAACLTCVRICPFGVATVERTAAMPQEKCQACGLCAAQCPAAAIALKRFGTNQMREDLGELLRQTTIAESRPGPLIVSFCCLFEATSRRFLEENPDEIRATGVARVLVPCVARLSVADMLAPFELGADGVVILACAEGECLYPTAEDRLLARIRRTKGILDEIGVGRERIDYWKTKGSAEVSWTAFWEVSRRKLLAIAASE